MSKPLLRGNGVAITIIVIALLVIIGGVTAVVMRPAMEEPTPSNLMPKTEEVLMEEEEMMEEEEESMDMEEKESVPAATREGSYEAYAPEKLALADSGDVVLFFRAVWCPTCRALDADIRNNLSAIPDGLTILDVNYDTETALKQKYGVTYQHTLVQVDSQGNLLKKWSGSPTLSTLVSQVQ